jgi:intein/homing endonuclease
MEDLRVHLDGTVRNANGQVVQLAYGEDGMDPVHLEQHRLPYLSLSPAEMRAPFLVTGASELGLGGGEALSPATLARLEAHFLRLLEDRRSVLAMLGTSTRTTISYPVNLERMVQAAADALQLAAPTEDREPVGPDEVLDTIDALEAELTLPGARKELGLGGNPLMGLLLRAFLSPKPLIAVHRLTPAALRGVAELARGAFRDALATPGEMVGVVAAMSMGEPLSQQSCLKDTEVIVRFGPTAGGPTAGGGYYKGPIGAFVDKLIDDPRLAGAVRPLGGGAPDGGLRSVVLDLPEPVYVVGVSSDERTAWRRVTQVSRHPARGDMVRLRTASGRTTCATLTHAFLRRTPEGRIATLTGAEVLAAVGGGGMLRMPVARSVPEAPDALRQLTHEGATYALTKDLGWLLGAYLADGNVSRSTVCISKVIPEFQERLREVFRGTFGLAMTQRHLPRVPLPADLCSAAELLPGGTAELAPEDRPLPQKWLRGRYMGDYDSCQNSVRSKPLAAFLLAHFGTGSRVKRVAPWAYASNRDFIAGLVGGYMDGDGCATCDGAHQELRTASVSPELTRDVADLLPYLGIHARIGVERRLDMVPPLLMHTLHVHYKYCRAFLDRVGLVVDHKRATLEQIVAYAENPLRREVVDANEFNHRAEGNALRRKAAEARDAEKHALRDLVLAEHRAAKEARKAAKARGEAVSASVPVRPLQPKVYENHLLDRIPAVGDAVSRLGVLHKLPSRLYGRHQRKVGQGREDAIGRETLRKYIGEFERAGREGPLALDLAGDLRVLEAFVGAAVPDSPTPALSGTAIMPDNVRDALTSVWKNSGYPQCYYKPLPRVHLRTLAGRMPDFRRLCAAKLPALDAARDEADLLLRRLRQAVDADVIWDPVTEAELVPDPGAYVYDLTVPSADGDPATDTFMVDGGLLVHNTLNSVEHATPLLLRVDGKLRHASIGDFVDGHIDGTLRPHARAATDLEAHAGDMWLGWLRDPLDGRVEVLSSDEDGRVAWTRVEAVTKHPVVNADGTDELLEVVLRSGRQVTATKAKSFLKRVGNRIVGVDGADLAVGDRLPVARVLPVEPLAAEPLAAEPLAAEPLVDLDPAACLAHAARIPAELFAAPLPFLQRLLGVYFAAHGAVSGARLVVTAGSRDLLGDVQQLLLRFGVVACRLDLEQGVVVGLSIGVEDARRFADQALLDALNNQHPDALLGEDIIPDVVLSTGTLQLHRDRLPALLAATTDAADAQVLRRIAEEQVVYDEVVSIRAVRSPHRYVYDLTVEGTRNFNTATGLCLRDTFHLSGVQSASTVITGVPRMKELLSVYKNIKTPAMDVFLSPHLNRSKALCEGALREITTTLLSDLVKGVSVHFDPEDASVGEDAALVAFHARLAALDPAGCNRRASPWLLRLEFDRGRMLETHVTMLDVQWALQDHFDDTVTCVFSDDNAKALVCRLRLSAPQTQGPEEPDVLTEVRALEQAIMEGLPIKGIRGIRNAVLVAPNPHILDYDPVLDTHAPETAWRIRTDGSNLRGVLAHPAVDAAATTSNDVYEVLTTLGIEAARQVLIEEVLLVLGGVDLNHRHISMLADTMSHRGSLMSIDRFGINHRGDLGPLAKCSFEQTADMLIKAGVFAERDRVDGVAANIILGQVAPCGTGATEVLLDMDRLERLTSRVPVQVTWERQEEPRRGNHPPSDRGHSPREPSDRGHSPREPSDRGHSPREPSDRGAYTWGPREPSDRGAYTWGPREPHAHEPAAPQPLDARPPQRQQAAPVLEIGDGGEEDDGVQADELEVV